MKRTAVTPGWKFRAIGLVGEPVIVDGLDLWKHEWRGLGESITVAHPSYPAERHTMIVYELVLAGRSLRFAAGELSNGVYGFFLPTA